MDRLKATMVVGEARCDECNGGLFRIAMADDGTFVMICEACYATDTGWRAPIDHPGMSDAMERVERNRDEIDRAKADAEGRCAAANLFGDKSGNA